ncbi:MAG: dihydropteroate synthase [Planctomycetes bacterium]|nr:dihydropteroate synthase [Planctomycetota bacterium]
MLIIAERLNCTRKSVNKAVSAKDAEFVRNQATRQVEAGADYVDVNSATGVQTEVDDMKWMIEQVRAVTDKPISVDTANPTAMREGLLLHGPGQPMVNSATAEQQRLDAVMPLAAEFQAKLVALSMDDSGMPETIDQRLTAVEKILKAASQHGVKAENIYIDPLIRPVSTNPTHAVDCMETVRRIKAEFGPLKTVGGLSNVSFGLPNRNLLNQAFLTLMLYSGVDAGIIDPLEPGVVGTILATEAILNRDEFCMNYIMASRDGRLG